jgi:Flp pilus assembly pilin Flp
MMMRNFIERLRSDQQGAAIIELAMAAPILALLVMAAADVGSVFSRKLALEQGAQRAVEKVMQTTELAMVQENIADEVAIQANVDASQAVVTFPRYCNDRPMTDTTRDDDGFAMGSNCDPGEVARHYILVTVTDEYDPIFPFLNMGTKLANGKYKVEAKAGMRTK